MGVFLICLTVVLLLGAVTYLYLSRRIDKDAETVSAETEQGKFVSRPRIDRTQWEGTVAYRGEEIGIHVRDRDGAPDPDQVARIPQVLGELAELEKVAHSELVDYFAYADGEPDDERLHAEQFSLSSVELGEKPHDLTLHYSYDDDAWGMSIFIQFEDGKVIDVTGVD